MFNKKTYFIFSIFHQKLSIFINLFFTKIYTFIKQNFFLTGSYCQMAPGNCRLKSYNRKKEKNIQRNVIKIHWIIWNINRSISCRDVKKESRATPILARRVTWTPRELTVFNATRIQTHAYISLGTRVSVRTHAHAYPEWRVFSSESVR